MEAGKYRVGGFAQKLFRAAQDVDDAVVRAAGEERGSAVFGDEQILLMQKRVERVFGLIFFAQGVVRTAPQIMRPDVGKDGQLVVELHCALTVAETLGGVDFAYDCLSAAILSGRHAVTANKALVAEKGIELAYLARTMNVSFLFSAACGGGVPFLSDLMQAVKTDRILAVGGILNGTTNYMLDAMQRRSLDYADALAEAQKLGYAEADPTADVSGLDALRKIALACAVAFDVLPRSGMDREGIESVTAADISDFRSRGYVCRLVARGGRNKDGSVYAYVEPALFPPEAPESAVPSNRNLAYYIGECAGEITLLGQGAGRYPTASAVLRDLTAAALTPQVMMPISCVYGEAKNAPCAHRYYVRLPSEEAGLFPGSETLAERGGDKILWTEKLAVPEMHRLAADVRARRKNVFFAETGE